ncbi:GNAT family N-acetyltransferase [Saccharothrix algeriensis]|uniref:GNAT family N-acetyltransferase n=1 Tax=Saccharothrix algeriensis TaxID=173560 RepID=A0A8T8HTS9_9PSEU|nr:GNAT family N-acetyltransferase [Saccharothrix algeriensis]MBM7813365.1 ribosomal protein S18 acetylase RimI-like enzyme [Saccharothrix algeriensis]QTR01896.1 GNAT family N-acetyltransferase [Saccharothrix algeriensis]
MYDIRFAGQDDLAAVLALLVRLQADTAHHIGYLGETLGELTEELAEFEPDWPSCTVVATDDSGRPCGVLSVEVDTELHRVFLHGPFVDVPVNHPAGSRIWDQTADALYAAAAPLLRGIPDREVYGHTEHRRLAAFAERHGFTAGRASGIYVLDGDGLRGLLLREASCPRTGPAREMRVLPTDAAVHEAVAVLHERCFPKTYLSGRKLVDGDGKHTVVVAMDGDRVLGYAAGKAEPGEYYVDFVAVEPDVRGGGVGAALVTELVWKLAERCGARPQAAASILAGNASSQRMFDRLGFRRHLELVAYRANRAA